MGPGVSRLLLILVASSIVLMAVPAACGNVGHPGFSVSISATPSSGSSPLFVTFSTTILSGTPTNYNWSFGDGKYLNGTATPANETPSHYYYLPGFFNATVTVWEGSEKSTSMPIEISVYSTPMVVHVSASPDQGTAPLYVLFNATVTGGTGTYTSFSWSFGDGGTGSGSIIEHTYSGKGEYHAVVTVKDSSGELAEGSGWINVTTIQSGTQTSGLPPYPYLIAGFVAGIVVALLAMYMIGRLGRRPPGPSELRPPEKEAHPGVAESDLVPEKGEARPEEVPAQTAPPVLSKTEHLEGPSTTTPKQVKEGEPVTLSQRVLVHMAKQGITGPHELAPMELTQGGIAEKLGVRQNVLTNVMKRLEEGELVTSSVTHVKGGFRRLKVYKLTPKGEALARELRSQK